MSIYDGEFQFTPEELDSLFGTNEQETPPVENNGSESDANTTPVAETKQTDVETTKAFAKRLAEKTSKAVAEEREKIAKDMGYESYEAMIKSKERKVIEDSGLDPESSNEAIDKIVQMRLDNDPRMQELSELRSLKVQEFGKKELSEITKLTNGEITDLNQIPKPVIELWKKCGSLKAAYLQLEGENLLAKTRSAQSKGTTDHLQSMGAGSQTIPNDKRPLTAEEKRVWKIFNPNLTDEELNKMTTKK